MLCEDSSGLPMVDLAREDKSVLSWGIITEMTPKDICIRDEVEVGHCDAGCPDHLRGDFLIFRGIQYPCPREAPKMEQLIRRLTAQSSDVSTEDDLLERQPQSFSQEWECLRVIHGT